MIQLATPNVHHKIRESFHHRAGVELHGNLTRNINDDTSLIGLYDTARVGTAANIVKDAEFVGAAEQQHYQKLARGPAMLSDEVTVFQSSSRVTPSLLTMYQPIDRGRFLIADAQMLAESC